ncbi:MAG TPA: hypothetical protein VH054_12125 [Polyangiaceae bacterium]|jgi:hypothetical protein|nr:hypothetical protein [Polyangiaceae bacterium]
MSPLLFVGPLLVAHLVTPTREVRRHGVVVHATSSEIDVRARGVTHRIHIGSPVQAIEIVDARTITTRSPGARVTYVDGRETSSCRFVSPTNPRVAGSAEGGTAPWRLGTLVRTAHGKTTYAMVRLGPADGSPCD